ncbi:MAG: cytochrome c [Anaerolineae bacterium]|nr:cytochrome c [Anaerolineae bacterium]
MQAKRRMIVLILSLLVLILGLAACGGDDGDSGGTGSGSPTTTPMIAPPPVGNAGNGEILFTAQKCEACHSLRAGVMMDGPSLAGIGAVAGQRVVGQDADAYLRQSIVEPAVFVVEGYTPGAMPAYAEMSEADLTDLVAFLKTLDE